MKNKLTSSLDDLDSVASLHKINNKISWLVESKPAKQWYFPFQSNWVFSFLTNLTNPSQLFTILSCRFVYIVSDHEVGESPASRAQKADSS